MLAEMAEAAAADLHQQPQPVLAAMAILRGPAEQQHSVMLVAEMEALPGRRSPLEVVEELARRGKRRNPILWLEMAGQANRTRYQTQPFMQAAAAGHVWPAEERRGRAALVVAEMDRKAIRAGPGLQILAAVGVELAMLAAIRSTVAMVDRES
jgi:hypothetical protein